MITGMREFAWTDQLAMYAATASGILTVALIVGGTVLLVRALLGGWRHG